MFTSAVLLKDITINRSAATKALTLFTTLLLASALTGCDAAAQAATQAATKVAEAVREAPPSGNSGESSVSPADVATALAQLETIPVKGRAPKTGYTREEFGPAWADVDRNGCDTRIICTPMTAETAESL